MQFNSQINSQRQLAALQLTSARLAGRTTAPAQLANVKMFQRPERNCSSETLLTHFNPHFHPARSRKVDAHFWGGDAADVGKGGGRSEEQEQVEGLQVRDWPKVKVTVGCLRARRGLHLRHGLGADRYHYRICLIHHPSCCFLLLLPPPSLSTSLLLTPICFSEDSFNHLSPHFLSFPFCHLRRSGPHLDTDPSSAAAKLNPFDYCGPGMKSETGDN